MPINRIPTKEFINVKQRNRLDSLITDKTPNSDPDLIKQVRDIILKEIEANANLFDPIDLDRFLSSDWMVTRFLLRKRDNVEEAAKMMIAFGKWRHKLRMPRWKDKDFPEEFYKLGGVFPYQFDTLGNTTIYVRAKLYDKKLSCIQDLFQRYLIHIANRVDEERDGRGWAIIFDCSGAGYSNLDVNMIIYMINQVVPHLPKGLNYVLIYELPWLLSKIVNGTIACLPSEYKKLVKTASKKDLCNWVDREALPDFMGGTCDINYRQTPPGCVSIREMAKQLNLDKKDLDDIEKVYKPYLDEADEALARRNARECRRKSSVAEFWYWMKNKFDSNNSNDNIILSNDYKHTETLKKNRNSNNNNKNININNNNNNLIETLTKVARKDQHKLSSIADNEDDE